MNKEDQTYLADESTPAEDIERYERALEELESKARAAARRHQPKTHNCRGHIRYPESRESKMPQLLRALARRRAKNKVAKQSRKTNRGGY